MKSKASEKKHSRAKQIRHPARHRVLVVRRGLRLGRRSRRPAPRVVATRHGSVKARSRRELARRPWPHRRQQRRKRLAPSQAATGERCRSDADVRNVTVYINTRRRRRWRRQWRFVCGRTREWQRSLAPGRVRRRHRVVRSELRLRRLLR